ncbi:MAG: DUF924 family protein [Xanthobacter sp.]
MSTQAEINAVLDFWRSEGPQKWFGGGSVFDEEVKNHLLPAYERAVAGELDDWQDAPESAVARIILLDQVPRNVFRGTPRAFATDPIALASAEDAVARGFDRDQAVNAPPALRGFFYLPFMHAENERAQARCVALYEAWGDENGLAFARIHQDAITRFGRFPHRNSILGRVTTPEEQAYLDGGGFSG